MRTAGTKAICIPEMGGAMLTSYGCLVSRGMYGVPMPDETLVTEPAAATAAAIDAAAAGELPVGAPNPNGDAPLPI